MKTRKFFRIGALLVAIIMLLTAGVQSTMAFVVTKSDSIINIFLPYKGLVSDLIISKTVEHPYGVDYVYPEGLAFDFKVELGDFYANTTIETTNGSVVADETGAFTVSVKPDSPVGIEDIDEGTEVKVTELTDNMGKGFSVKDEVNSYDVKIPESGSVVVEIVNVYSPEGVVADNVNLTGNKVLEGRDWQEGDSFSFLLEMKNSDGEWADIGIKTVTYDEEDPDFSNFDFSDVIHGLEFTEAGTYSFRVSEIEGELEEVDYDKSVNYFNIIVADPDMDGDLDIVDVVVNQNITLTKNEEFGSFDMTVVFNNTFVPEIKPIPDDITVGVALSKNVQNKGTAELGAEGFRFILENTETSEQIVLVSDEAGAASVDLTFSADDAGKTFTYELYEKNEGKAYITYDETVYEISISVSLDEVNNVLVAEVLTDGQKADTSTCVFENIYDYTPPTAPPTSDDYALPLTLFITSMVILALLFITRKKNAGFFE